MNSKSSYILLTGTLLFAAYVRLSNLGVPSFWVDELDFVEAAVSMQKVGEPLLRSGYAYPRAPVLTRLLQLSFSWFGVSEFSSRLPSALLGLLMIPLIYLLGRRWFNERTGLLAAIFVACDPFQIGWSRACRMYALFQFSFIAAMLFFWAGWEAAKNSGHAIPKGKLGVLSQSWQVDIRWLLCGMALLFLSYTSHPNAALFAPCFATFTTFMLIRGIWKAGPAIAFKSKYGIVSCLFWGVLICAMLLPAAREFLSYALGYQPKWAETASAQNQWRIFDFLFARDRLPMNALFLLGAVIALLTWQRAGIFAMVTLLVPVILFSFVFEYRKNDYIFNVYPFFFVLAAYGLDCLFQFVEKLLRKPIATTGRTKLLRQMLMLGPFLWIPLTPNFRFAQKIPRLPDGFFNGAIYHNEWKAAASYLEGKVGDNEVLLSTLPLSVQHYVGRADFNLNWSNADLSVQRNYVNERGQYVDFYSGTEIIDSLSKLEEVLTLNQTAWLLVDNYRFGNPAYVPKEVHDYIISIMPRVFQSERKTVSVYRWQNVSKSTAMVNQYGAF